MRFDSYEARMRHEQARLIPEQLWADQAFFNNALDDRFVLLMQADGALLVGHLQSLTTVPLNNQEQQCVFLAVALGHPSMSLDNLLEMAHQLKLSNAMLCELAVVLGHDAIFNDLLSATVKRADLLQMPFEWFSQLFVKIAAYGRLAFMRKMSSFSALAMLS